MWVDKMTDTERLLRFVQERRQVRWKDVSDAGLNPDLLYRLLERGEIERVGRGLYRAPGAIASQHESLAEVAQLVPLAVISLLSALSFHGIGSQMPGAVWIALDRSRTRSRPRVRHLPIKVLWFSGPAFTEGQEVHDVDGISVRVYSPAKTVADLFKYRGKVGLDVAVEALREGLADRRFTPAEVEAYAGVCRVSAVMKPFLQAMTG
jgi:predicted transcriptional regulator of viral defense system